MRLLIMTVLLFSINSNAETQPSYPKIVKALKIYCAKCDEPSLANFQNNVEALERFVNLTDKGIFYDQGLEYLIDSYMKLAFGFVHNDDDLVRNYIDKIYIYELQKLKTLHALHKIYGNSKSLLRDFNKVISDKSVSHAVSVHFENMVTYLKIEEEDILEPILNGLRYFDYLKLNHENIKPVSKERIPKSTQALFKRIKYLRLTKQDKLLINAYAAIFYDYRDLKRKRNSEDHDVLIELLIEYIKSNQLSLQETNYLSKSAMIFLANNRSKKNINDIIWWIEARNDTNLEGQLEFLNNQMLSTRKFDALNMLVELGQVEVIEKWSKKQTFKDSEIIYNLSIRKAQIRKIVLENSANLANHFKQDLIQSINEIVNSDLFESAYYQDYISWLTVQIGLLRYDEDMQRTFKNLLNYCNLSNFESIKKLSKERKIEVNKLLSDKMAISHNIQYALNTFRPINDN